VHVTVSRQVIEDAASPSVAPVAPTTTAVEPVVAGLVGERAADLSTIEWPTAPTAAAEPRPPLAPGTPTAPTVSRTIATRGPSRPATTGPAPAVQRTATATATTPTIPGLPPVLRAATARPTPLAWTSPPSTAAAVADGANDSELETVTIQRTADEAGGAPDAAPGDAATAAPATSTDTTTSTATTTTSSSSATTPGSGTASTPAGAASAGRSEAEILELARALYPQLQRRLAREFLLDRERAGYRTDIRF
jgi:hypothetical protein